MPGCLAWICTLGLSALGAAPTDGSASVGPLLAPVHCQAAAEQQLLEDGVDGAWDRHSLLQAALVASGVTAAAAQDNYVRRFAEIESRLRAVIVADAGPRRASQVFEFLHRELLRGEYRTDCSQVDVTLDGGNYNCVTATVLYQCLCQAVGLDPAAVAEPAHVYSRFAEYSLDVQTTARHWFQRPEFPPPSTGHGRSLTDVELVAKLYYNRGVAALARPDFAEAVRLLMLSTRLDPRDSGARENLLAAINNWSLALCDASQFAAAVGVLEYGQSLAPAYGPFLANDLHIHQRWAVRLCEEQQFAAAAELLDKCHHRRPDVELFDQGRFAVHCAWATALFEQGQAEAAWQRLETLRARFPERSEVSAMEAAAIEQGARRLSQRGGTAEAAELLRQGLERQPNHPRLRQVYGDLTGSRS